MKPQLILPCIPAGATEINYRVGVWRADDLRMFRIVTSQLINSGGCRQTDILRTFGVSKSSIIRSLILLCHITHHSAVCMQSQWMLAFAGA
jgi:hypothetical protein